MKTFIIFIAIGLLTLSCAGFIYAAAQSSKAEAEALAIKAAEYIKTHGKDKALAEFNNPNGEFIKNDLYVFAYDFSGVNKAGNNPKLLGSNLIDTKDPDGKYLIKGLIEVAKKGGGWYNYKWPNPVTNETQNKASYVIKVDDSLLLGCGVYL